jgi:hypothetical protein
MMEIDVTGIDLVKFVKETYKLSGPQGLGFLNYEEGELTDDEVEDILKIWEKDKQFRLSLDYVKGRACKMTIFRKEDKLYIRTPWYDHTDDQLRELLLRTQAEGMPFPVLEGKHSISCNCEECRKKAIHIPLLHKRK